MRLFIYFVLVTVSILFLTVKIYASPGKSHDIQSWGYLLQNVTADTVINSPFELVVIEPQLETDSSHVFSQVSVNRMKSMGGSKKPRIVLAYLSIGEAEDFRPYWNTYWKKSPPPWLGKVNPDWEGNYKVRYWFPEWQQIILKQIEAILISGFDGIYLDIVDAWEYWGNEETYESGIENQQNGDPAGDYETASRWMLDWLTAIGNYSHRRSPNARLDMMIYPQNGEYLLNYLGGKDRERFWNLVDGIGVESVFFYGDKDENNPLNLQKGRLKILDEFLKHGKMILSAEYLTKASLKKQHRDLARKHGFIPYAAIRELDELILH